MHLLLVSVLIVANYNVTILVTQHIGGQITPTTPDTEIPCELDKWNECFGGMGRRAAVIESIRATEENVLLIDIGRLIFGNFNTSSMSYFANALEFDLLAPNSGDFHSGTLVYASFINSLSNTTAVVATNLDVSRDPGLNMTRMSKWAVKETKLRQKIGFVNLIRSTFREKTTGAGASNLEVNHLFNEQATAQKGVTDLQRAHPDCAIIIAITAGLSGSAEYLFGYLEGIDIIICRYPDQGPAVLVRQNMFGQPVARISTAKIPGLQDSVVIKQLSLQFDKNGLRSAASALHILSNSL